MTIFTKICPVGNEPKHADRRTDMTKQVRDFRDFANARTDMNKENIVKLNWQQRHRLNYSRVIAPKQSNMSIFTS